MQWIVFSLILLLQLAVTYPLYTSTCVNPNLGLYFFHHILDVFLFGSIFFLQTRFEHQLHALLAIVVMIHWVTNKNQCIATVWMNRQCGYPEEQWLDSLKNRMGFTGYFHFWWLGAWVLWDAKRITLDKLEIQ